MDLSCDVTAIQSLKKILDAPHGEESRLNMLAELETRHGNGPGLEILSCLCKMAPLMKSLVGLRRLMMLFSRKLIQLLDEMKILKNSEVAKKTLQLLKQFWSLCSNQQAGLAPHQICGQWEPDLIDIVTSMASVYVDLFLVAYEHADNQALWSKRLYSWLAFDLNQRALKTAFLEVSCPVKKASVLLTLVLSKILSCALVSESHLDYLLHMLLVNKWSSVLDDTNIVETSRNMKAPKQFVTWLSEKWLKSHDYIPQDKSFKGRRVSEFLLDLDDAAVESLTDMYSDCLSGKEDPNDITITPSMESEVLPSTSLFVLDKKGSNEPMECSETQSGLPPSDDVPGSSSKRPEEIFILDKRGSKKVPIEVDHADGQMQGTKEKKGKGKQIKGKRSLEEAEIVPAIPDRKAAELDFYIIPDRSVQSGSSPSEKKERNLRAGDHGKNNVTNRVVDVRNNVRERKGSRKFEPVGANGEVEILNDGGDDLVSDNEEDNPLGLDNADFEVLAEEVEEEPEPAVINSKTRQRKRRGRRSVSSEFNTDSNDNMISLIDCNDDDDVGGVVDVDAEGLEIGHESDVEEVVVVPDKEEEKKGTTPVKGVREKRLVVSDPVSSYFAPQMEVENNHDIRVFDLTQDLGGGNEEIVIEEKNTSNLRSPLTDKRQGENLSKGSAKVRSQQRRNVRGKGKVIESPTVTEGGIRKNQVEDAHTLRKSISLSSSTSSSEDGDQRKPEKDVLMKKSPHKAINVVHSDSSDDVISFKADWNVNVARSRLEEDISRQLSDIRQSVSQTNESEGHSEATESSTPSRMSARRSTKPDSGKSAGKSCARTPSKARSTKRARDESDASTSFLKDWLRSPPQKSVKLGESPRSPSKTTVEEKVQLHGSPSALQISSGHLHKTPNVELKVKEKHTEPSPHKSPNKPSPQKSPNKQRRSLKKCDIFPPTYSESTPRSLPKEEATPVPEKTTLPPGDSASGEQHDSPEAKLYNLRTPQKSSSLKSPGLMKSSRIDSYFPSQEKSTPKDQLQLSSKTSRSTKGKTKSSNRSKTIAEPENMTPKTPTKRKTVQTPSKSSPTKSTPNRRKSLRSSNKAD